MFPSTDDCFACQIEPNAYNLNVNLVEFMPTGMSAIDNVSLLDPFNDTGFGLASTAIRQETLVT